MDASNLDEGKFHQLTLSCLPRHYFNIICTRSFTFRRKCWNLSYSTAPSKRPSYLRNNKLFFENQFTSFLQEYVLQNNHFSSFQNYTSTIDTVVCCMDVKKWSIMEIWSEKPKFSEFLKIILCESLILKASQELIYVIRYRDQKGNLISYFS